MDKESKDLLKRDLFVLDLAWKWQEKVLPSTKDLGDCLHQARAAEEQERQLKEIHNPQGTTDYNRSSEPTNKSTKETTHPRSTDHSSSSPRYQRCGKCGSTRHRQRDCPQEHPPSKASGRDSIRTAKSSIVKASGTPCQGETLDEQCGRLADELAKVEFERITNEYRLKASVDAVSGSLGPLYYATVNVAGVPVDLRQESCPSNFSRNLDKKLESLNKP